MKKLELALYFSKKELEYVFFDTFIHRIIILAYYENLSEFLAKLFVRYIKYIQWQHIKKIKEYRAIKKVWYKERKCFTKIAIRFFYIAFFSYTRNGYVGCKYRTNNTKYW